MKTNYEIRYASNPTDAKAYDTKRLRKDFLIQNLFVADEVNMVYSMYDRMVVGGAKPVKEELLLEAIDPLKAEHFLTRREIGIYNVGGAGLVKVGDEVFELGYKEALYLGRGERDVRFVSKDPGKPALFYFNSGTAHMAYPDKKVTKADAVVAEHLGVAKGTDVLVCARIRLADDEPVVYTRDYLSPRLTSPFLGVTDENISLYSFLKEATPGR